MGIRGKESKKSQISNLIKTSDIFSFLLGFFFLKKYLNWFELIWVSIFIWVDLKDLNTQRILLKAKNKENINHIVKQHKETRKKYLQNKRKVLHKMAEKQTSPITTNINYLISFSKGQGNLFNKQLYSAYKRCMETKMVQTVDSFNIW